MTNKELIYFVVGGVVGGIVGWLATKDKYEKKYREEVNEVRDALKKDAKEETEKNDISDKKPPHVKDKPDIMAYAAKLAELRYSKPVSEPITESIHVVSPDEFGEIEDYMKISLRYFKGDNTLVDDLGEVVDESIVGDALEHFGEYEDDSVFCRDDEKRCDYEILLELGSYANSEE